MVFSCKKTAAAGNSGLPEAAPDVSTVQVITPINASLGAMLQYSPSRWRNPEYETFSFNLNPHIFYLVTKTFTVQSRFLKRLAFFTEKPGFAGTLARDEDIAGLRDWFAHDYSAGDLAAFFELARKENFALNSSEIELRDMLLAQGIIKNNGSYTEGEGALIGLSIESRDRLPVYYAHETIHGLEFTMPELQKLFMEFFDSLSSLEKNFIRTALVYRDYNVLADKQLLASETAAYLLQQKPEETEKYFREYVRPWYVAYQEARRGAVETEEAAEAAEYTDPVMVFLAENPGIFGRRSAALQKSFRELTGLGPETFYDLLPKDRNL
ncbi:hypothetical protein AGMMS50230_20570 [Spirochaetia bacterium]|nr:hypothetical protein AGMMS50230_20570 [Spirochaetia bacterium]